MQQANARVAAAAKQLKGAVADQGRAVTNLRQDAVAAYVGAGPQFGVAGSVPLGNLNDALVRQELEATFAADQSDALDSYRLAAAVATTAKAQLELARNAAAKQVRRLEADRQQVQAAENQLVSLQQGVNGQIGTLVSADRSRGIGGPRKGGSPTPGRREGGCSSGSSGGSRTGAGGGSCGGGGSAGPRHGDIKPGCQPS